MASMLVASMPRSAKRLVAASNTLLCARWLSPRAMSLNHNSRKSPCAQAEERHGDDAQNGGVGQRAKVRLRHAKENSAQPIDTIGEWIEQSDEGQHLGKIVQRKERARQKENRKNQ